MNFLENLFKKDNLMPRIISFIVACGLWAYVMMEQNPVIERYYEVPLKEKNVAENMVVFNAPDVVTVQVRASRLLLDDNAVKDITADIDLKNAYEGKNRLFVNTSFAKGEVVNVLPKEVAVYVDRVSEKVMPVVTSAIDNFDEDITVKDSGITPAKVVVKGALTRLAEIDKITAPVSIKGQRENFQAECILVAVDKNGKAINDVQIIPDKAVVDAVIVRKVVSADLPVKVSIQGALQEGLAMGQVQLLPETVHVTAPPSVMKHLKEINTQSIDVTRLTTSMAMNVDLDLPDNVVSDVKRVQVRFSVERQ